MLFRAYVRHVIYILKLFKLLKIIKHTFLVKKITMGTYGRSGL